MQDENYIIRMAGEEDFEQVKNLLEMVGLPTDGVSENIKHFHVLENGKAIAGVAGIEVFDKEGLLRSMAVTPALQGKGKGSELFDAVLRYSKELKLDHLYLLTETAERFFHHRGFNRVDRRKVGSEMKDSVEFKSLCPGSAICMYKKL